ncbi:putative bifunctional diguanylate cyclase/phosphodiesterase [Caulobacter hibisci]|uniref:EAL domain-containing protein n=1 Tax=Caulobacter hibisci TaxID=2035993 RepID=A0ABS0T0X4_9CAUL|nr:EAL domain-containing protein [Caulobacter hibisci]MBI1685489.1 EAL domain-containing protein [Caulobacter hibisci]
MPWFRPVPPTPELLKAQVRAFSRQVPMMYALVLVNTIALSATHLDNSPPLLTLGFPGLLGVISLVRLVTWWRARGTTIDQAGAKRMLRQTLVFAGVLGLGFTLWAFSLFPYGDAFTKAHVVFYMAITAIGCVFCLMHMRAAAFLLTAIVVGPIAVFLLASGNPVLTAIGFNMALVAIAMLVILLISYRDFSNLVESQRGLEERQAEIQSLSDDYLRMANLDGLTGLPNRRQFFSRLQRVTDQAAAEGRRFAVGVIDLDGFKPVNDAYGHAVGDRVLVEAGERLGRNHGQPLFVARLGGDEYGLIIEADLAPEALQRLGADLCAALREPYCFPGVTAQVSGSVGFAVYPQAATAPNLLYERADYALYHAKQNIRGAAVVFSADHETAIKTAGLIEQALRHADMDTEFRLAFQPLVDIRSERTVGFEALARWTSPTLGVVSPGDFVPVAERSGLIARMSPVLLSWALDAAKTWPEDQRLSFNLSVRDIASPEQIARIIEIIELSGVDPGRIDLEVTETAVMRDFDQAARSLAALKALGVRIALDDFGAGYSSLSYVHRLPIDKLKIDGSFMRGLGAADKRRAIVKTILDLCRNLGLDCVVEGVEEPEQLVLLRPLGCRVVQGFLFARPMPGEAVAGYLAAERGEADAVELRSAG